MAWASLALLSALARGEVCAECRGLAFFRLAVRTLNLFLVFFGGNCNQEPKRVFVETAMAIRSLKG